MAQLPRCMQQAPWKRMTGVCSLTIRSLSSAEFSGKCCSVAAARSVRTGSSFALWPSQSLLVVCGPSQKLSSSVRTDLICDRLRVVLRRASSSFSGSLVSGDFSLRLRGLPALGSFSGRSFSTADASTVVDGEVKDFFTKEDKDLQKNTLLAEIEAKELELEELRSALKQVESVTPTVNGHESNAESSVEDQGLHSSSASSEHVDTEDSSTSETSFLLAEVGSTSGDSSDDEDIGVIAENDSVVHFGNGTEFSSSSSTPDILVDAIPSEGALESSMSEEAVEGNDVPATSAPNVESEETPTEHPWPQWTRFLKHLAKGNYFANDEGKEIDIDGYVSSDDYGLIKRACLNFARERDDIFTGFAQKDLEIIARFGCPTTDRKLVNAGKRLREYLKIDEVSICKPCVLRPSCERADFRVASDHVAGTAEVIRLLSQYALNVSPGSEKDLKIPEVVHKSCTNLLQQAVTLGSKARDPKSLKFERKAQMVKSDRDLRVERGPRRREGDADVELKPGDWKCPQCDYTNFARNRTCRECDSRRPEPEMRPGDWTCPECNFLNFSRNRECHDCKAERPPGVGYEAVKKGSRSDREGSYDRGNRGDREGSYERGSSMGDRGYGRDRERSDLDRGSSRSYGNRDRGSFDRSDRSRERGTERGMDRRSRGYEERDSYDRRSPRGDGSRGSFERRSAGTEERSSRRKTYEEWKPDLSRKDEFVDEDVSEKPAKGRKFGDDFEDLDLDDDDDEDVEDVAAFDDEEYEDMRLAASGSRGGNGSSDRRPVGRSREDDRPRWEDDRSRSSGKWSGRGGRGGDRDQDRGGRDTWSPSSSGGGRGGGRGGSRGGGRGASRGRGGSGGRGRR